MAPGLKFFFLIFLAFENAIGYMVGNNPHHRRESLDPQGRFQLEWLVDWENKEITFTATVQTTGYVGVGLSRNGKMTGADIVIGGVNRNGKAYFADYHAVGHQTPIRDPNQNWNLISGRENRTHTILRFSRAFDTCDDQDYLISEDKVSLIWALGETDKIGYHHGNRGVFATYLQTPDYAPQIITDPYSGAQRVLDEHGNIDTSVNVWTIDREMVIPQQRTTYWCTMHRQPHLRRANHLIGFNVRLHDENTRSHVHHLIMLHCKPPRSGPSADSMFGPFVGTDGEECLDVRNPQPDAIMPTTYCVETRNIWGPGGFPYFQPHHVGLPFESGDYIMLQIHMDNPALLSNSRVRISLDTFYTEKLRPNEGGHVSVRHGFPGLPPSVLIPPYSIEHHIRGTCGSECTRQMIPPGGISVYGVFLHTHNAGRRMRLRHFRNNRELPFISIDDNYQFSYQQVRTLAQERRVLPGDQVAIECVYDSTLANGTVVGGFGTNQEMCGAWLIHYQRLNDIYMCASQIESVKERRYFLAGVGNITWSNSHVEFLVDPPHPLAGLTISQVSDNHVDWTVRKRKELRDLHLFHPQINTCGLGPWVTFPNAVATPGVTITYPFTAKPYQPDATCPIRSSY